MDDAHRLHALGTLLGQPDGFVDWCRRHDVTDVPVFLHLELDAGTEGSAIRWRGIQMALRSAQRAGLPEAVDQLLAQAPGPRTEPLVLAAAAVMSPQGGRVEPTVRGLLRQILARLGGIAGIEVVGLRAEEILGRKLERREIKGSLRGVGVTSLGAGFYSVTGGQTVADFTQRWLANHGPCLIDDWVDAVLGAFPHGARSAVLSWLQQRPDGLAIEEGRVFLV